MTPQERQLVTELFDRLATLENAPRDPDADRAIAEGLARAPHATYALVQTALVQDEALKRANARIQELEGQPAEEPSRGFLDNMRDSLFGREEPRGSVPRAGGLGSSGVWGRPGDAPQGGPPGMGPGPAGGMGAGPGAAGPGMGPGMGPGYGPGVGTGGGSFLGTAAASAAGVIGGAMLLNGIRSMFGHSYGGASAFDRDAAGGSPWSGGSAANSDLARDAGVDHVGGDRSAARGFDSGNESDRASAFGDDDQDDDTQFGDDDDTDFAGEV